MSYGGMSYEVWGHDAANQPEINNYSENFGAGLLDSINGLGHIPKGLAKGLDEGFNKPKENNTLLIIGAAALVLYIVVLRK